MLANPLEEFRDKLSLADDALEGVVVMVLPENLSDPVDELYDTTDSVELAKFLKAQGINCKTAFDFGLKPKVYERRGVDIWAGVVWITEFGAMPTFVSLFVLWLTTKLRGDKSSTIVHFELRLQDGDKIAKMVFDGPMSGLEKLLLDAKDQESLTDDTRVE